MRFEYSTEYIELINKLSEHYRLCLSGFVEEFSKENKDNLCGIVLYGGLVRDRTALPEWSDIDLAVIYNEISRRNIFHNTAIKQKYERTYQIRIDLNEVSLSELGSMPTSICYNSELTNALSFRNHVSISVFHDPPLYLLDVEMEKKAAVFYINDTLFRYRKYLNEHDFTTSGSSTLVPRLIRWYFSIIRASLRLEGIYVNPYEESIECLNKLYPSLDLSVLMELAAKRRDGTLSRIDDLVIPELVLNIDQSLNEFIHFFNERWHYESI